MAGLTAEYAQSGEMKDYDPDQSGFSATSVILVANKQLLFTVWQPVINYVLLTHLPMPKHALHSQGFCFSPAVILESI